MNESWIAVIIAIAATWVALFSAFHFAGKEREKKKRRLEARGESRSGYRR